MQIIENDENNIESVLFKLLDIPDEEEEEDDIEGLEGAAEDNNNDDRESKMSSAQHKENADGGESIENGEGENKS